MSIYKFLQGGAETGKRGLRDDWEEFWDEKIGDFRAIGGYRTGLKTVLAGQERTGGDKGREETERFSGGVSYFYASSRPVVLWPLFPEGPMLAERLHRQRHPQQHPWTHQVQYPPV